MKQYILRPSDRCYSANAITNSSKTNAPREKPLPRPATSPPYGYTDEDKVYSRATRAQYLEFSHDSRRSLSCEHSKQHGHTKQRGCSKQLEHPRAEQLDPNCSILPDPLRHSEPFQHAQRSERTRSSRHTQRSQNSQRSIRSHDPVYIEELDGMSSLEIINEHRRLVGRRPISEGPGVAFVDYFQEAVTPPRSPSFASWPPVSAASANSQTCCLPFARRKCSLWTLIPCIRRRGRSEKVHRLRIDPSDNGNDWDLDNESFSSYYASVDPVSEKYSDPSNCSSDNFTAEDGESVCLSRLSNTVNFDRARPRTY